MTSPLRGLWHAGFDFIAVETLGPPELRTTKSVFEACALIEAENLKGYLGLRQ